MVSSIIAFNEKRGAAGFGRGVVASDLEYVRSLGAWAARLEHAYARRSDRAIVVRYEDLVLDPGPALRGLLEHVGVESSEPIVGRMVDALASGLAELAEHRTAADPRDSIGRWQRDLGDELLGACDEAFGPALEAFGYER
jgi:hypothetical protein